MLAACHVARGGPVPSNPTPRFAGSLGGVTDVLKRITDHKITRLDELTPWRYAQV